MVDNSSGSQRGLEQIIYANGVVATSDLHGNDEILKNSLSYSRENGYALAINGDVVNDYGFTQLAEEMGYKTPQQMEREYVGNLGEQEQQVYQMYMMAQEVESNGIEGVLQQVPEEAREQAKGELEDLMRQVNTQEFQEYVSGIRSQFLYEKGDELEDHMMGFQALYQVFMDEEAKRVASIVNEYGSDVPVLFNHGNHENAYFARQLQQYLDNPEQLADMNAAEGYYRVIDSQGRETTMAATTNCVQPMPYIQELFGPEELAGLYQHMNFESLNEDQVLIGNVSKEDLESKAYTQDPEYRRIKKGEDGSLDVLLSHGQIGMPYMSEEGMEGYSVPYFASAAALGLESKLIVEGHIHNKYEGKNSFGSDMVRAVGEEAALIYKDEEGNVRNDWVKVGENYGSGMDNPIPYSVDYLQERVEDLVSYFKQMQSQNSGYEADSTIDYAA